MIVSSVQLVRDVLRDEQLDGELSREQHRSCWKHAVHELRSRSPDEECAMIVVEASRQGQIPSWLTAALLGAIRHPAGYRTVLELLCGGENRYTGHALVEMSRSDAFSELAVILASDGWSWQVYEAAADGLGEIVDPRVVDLLEAAVEAVPEKIRPSVAGLAMRKQVLEPARLLSWLRGDSLRLRSVAVRAVGHRRADERIPEPLRQAVLDELDRAILFIGQAERGLIRRRLSDAVA